MNIAPTFAMKNNLEINEASNIESQDQVIHNFLENIQPRKTSIKSKVKTTLPEDQDLLDVLNSLLFSPTHK
jgi:hypothetical protein